MSARNAFARRNTIQFAVQMTKPTRMPASWDALKNVAQVSFLPKSVLCDGLQ